MAYTFFVLTTFLFGCSIFLSNFSHAFSNHLNNSKNVDENSKDGEMKKPEEIQMYSYEDYEYIESNMAVSGEPKVLGSAVTSDDKNLKNEKTVNNRLLFQRPISSISGKLTRKPRDASNTTTKNRKTRAEKYPCYKYGRCSHNNLTYPPNCYCDDACVIYNDCCHDAGAGFNFTSTLPFEKIQYLYNYTSCQYLYSSLDLVEGEVRGFYMVNRCPSNFSDQSVENKCAFKNVSKLLVPVTDPDGITYRNMYCAICHGVTSFSSWELGFTLGHCDTEFDFISLDEMFKNVKQKLRILNKNCYSMFSPPSQFTNDLSTAPRVCINSRKYWTDKTPSKRCQKYQNPVLMSDNTLVRNYNCLKKKAKNETFNCVDPTVSPPVEFNLNEPVNGSISTILAFEFKVEEYPDYCFHKSLALMKMDDINLCVKETVRNYPIKVKVVLMSTVTPSVDVFKRAVIAYYKFLPVKKYKLKLYDPDGKENNADVVCGENVLGISNACCITTLNLSFIVEAEIGMTQLLFLKAELAEKKFNYNELHEDLHSPIRIYRFIESYHQRNFDPMSHMAPCEFSTWGVKVLQQFNINYDLIESMKLTPQANLNNMVLNNLLMGDSSFKFETAQNQQDVTSSTSPITLPFVHDFTRDLIGVYTFVKYFVMGISILSLIITLILYIYLGHYTSLIGQICINIMTILILSNFVYLFGIEATDNKIVCSVIGAILHYTWTCSFTWVSVYALLVSQIISKLKVNLSINSDIYFSKQSIYFGGYCFPLILVIPCVVMEIIQDSNLNIGYNVELCFLSVYPANIIFLSGPIILSVGITFVILLVLSKFKRNYDPKEIHVSSRICLEYINGFVVYCLGSFLLWILGISVQVFKKDIPGYVFTMVIGAHGPLFAICILVTQKVQNFICFSSNHHPEKCLEPPNECSKICSESIDRRPLEWPVMDGENFEKFPNVDQESFENHSAKACQGNSPTFVHKCPDARPESTYRDIGAISESSNWHTYTNTEMTNAHADRKSEGGYDAICPM